VLGFVERLSEAVCCYLRGGDVRELDRGAGQGGCNCRGEASPRETVAWRTERDRCLTEAEVIRGALRGRGD
jgi:hypothetical protein